MVLALISNPSTKRSLSVLPDDLSVKSMIAQYGGYAGVSAPTAADAGKTSDERTARATVRRMRYYLANHAVESIVGPGRIDDELSPALMSSQPAKVQGGQALRGRLRPKALRIRGERVPAEKHASPRRFNS